MQSVLEETIEKVTQERVRVLASGRTDAGAHACGQVVAFDTRSALRTEVLGRALNATLPMDVSIISTQEALPDFHPRFDATSRTYRYVIHNRRVRSPFWHGRSAHIGHHVDDNAMNQGAGHLVGTHDFGAFAPAALGGSHVRTIFDVRAHRHGDLVMTDVRANGFMRQMVRSIMGTLVEVGTGRALPGVVGSVLSSRDRSQAGNSLPACGLYLIEVHYAPDTMFGPPAVIDPDVPFVPVHGTEERE